MFSPRKLPALLAVLAGGLLLPPAARATSVLAPEFDSLVNQADYIVRAEVTAVVSDWQENPNGRHIITRVTLDVKEVIAGTPPTPLVLEFIGGKIGDEEMTIEGTPKFLPGEESILFLHAGKKYFCPVVALMHGCYPVMADIKTKQPCVLRSNGVPLYETSEVSLPLTSLRQPDLKRQPLRPAQFSDQIRARRHSSRQTHEN